MKKLFIIIGIIVLSLILTFSVAVTLSLYHFGSAPTGLTIIYLVSLFCIINYLIFSMIYIIYKKIKKEKIERIRVITIILLFISLLLILGFIFMLDLDYLNYYSNFNSAPFYVYIIVRGIEFLVPSILLIVISIFLLRRKKNS